ncbi:hypothetical protein MATR_32890 [Marivirga tractuosa]|nr:hypothetical protein MATR_32890 [Marivirga tractuosa]
MKKILLTCFMLVFVLYAWAQDRTVTGKVVDAGTGESLPGVNVILKGTGTGVNTDIDGNYKISVPSDGGTLVFTFIGMNRQEVKIGSRSVIDVSMEANIEELSEVVVTGYTSETRDKLSGSIGSVQAEQLEQVPMPSFDQILQGRTPGLYVTSGSGQPGAGATVRIRGSGSINASNDPLYVMDGVPINASEFATINPNDFESVSVLKDASATALYGSRGANGVIVITTKRGKAGETKINYRFQTGWSEQARVNFEMMDAEEKVAFEQLVGSGLAGSLDPNDPDDAEELERLRNTNTDWQDIFTRTGRTNTHEINASGGNENTNYYVSFNYFNQEGQA